MLLYAKNTYILKLLLNVVTSGIDSLVLENSFVYASELSHVLYCATIKTLRTTISE
jgi:hypothetical protein